MQSRHSCPSGAAAMAVRSIQVGHFQTGQLQGWSFASPLDRDRVYLRQSHRRPGHSCRQNGRPTGVSSNQLLDKNIQPSVSCCQITPERGEFFAPLKKNREIPSAKSRGYVSPFECKIRHKNGSWPLIITWPKIPLVSASLRCEVRIVGTSSMPKSFAAATRPWFGLQGNDCDDSHLVGVLR
jgi:hypothetical protein